MATPQPSPKSPKRDLGFFGQITKDVVDNVKLFWRLFRHKQVSWWLKFAWVLASFLYWILPDLMPGLPIDDVAAPIVFTYVFNALVPQWLVAEVRSQLEREEKGELPPKPVSNNPTPSKDASKEKPAKAEPTEPKVQEVKLTGRYCVQNGTEQKFVTIDQIGDAKQVWEEYLEPQTGRNMWRRYRK